MTRKRFELPPGDTEILIEVATLDDWLWLDWMRSQPLPLADHRRLQEVWIRCLHVPTTRDKNIAKAVGIARRRSGGTQRRWLGINGVTDLGKTDLIVHMSLQLSGFEQGNVRYRDGGRHRQLPVLYVEASKKHAGTHILRDMCQFAGIPEGGPDDVLVRRLRHELPRMGTILVIVDDAHMLRRTSRTSTTLPDTLRVLLRLPVTYIFVGAGLSESAIQKGGLGPGFESADQMRTRGERLDLLPMRLPESGRLYDDMILKFAGKVTAGIPGMQFPGLRDPRVREKLFDCSRGLHAKIFCCLKDASVYALTNGTRTVDTETIGLFLDQQPDEPHGINPDEWPDEVAIVNG